LDQSAIEWERYNKSNFPFVLRQREGRDNSLGIIKFSFDNPYAVYLHDTNNKNLFNSDKRAFSHGCIRIEKALELAKFLVRNEERSGQLDGLVLLKKRQTFEIIPPVPIYVRYFTCEVKQDHLIIYADIYRLDEKAAIALYQQETMSP
jgi:murein L,D-transpeptidase YcbB/YkuD